MIGVLNRRTPRRMG